MKKLAFIAVLIAVVVGIVFGGISMAASSAPVAPSAASSAPAAPVPKPTPTPDPWIYITQKLNEIDSKVTALQSDVDAIKNDVRPGSDKFKTDEQNIQFAVSAFYSDLHAGWKDINGNDNLNDATTFNDNVWGRTNPDTVAGHYYPTAIAYWANHVVTNSTTQFDPIRVGNALLLGSGGSAATDAEIQAHAIWMGLLVNENGSGTIYAGLQDRDLVSPLAGERDLYLNKVPDSAMSGNGYNGCLACCGHYCWVVGKNGLVYGAYKSTDGNWYSGFNCSYP